jgi:hypothetical protein
MPRKQDIPDAVYDLLVDLRLRIRERPNHPAEVKKAWYDEAQRKCGWKTAQLVLWMLDTNLSPQELADARVNTDQSTGGHGMANVNNPQGAGQPPDPTPQGPAPAVASGLIPEKGAWGSPAELLGQAIEAVPSVKYALGITGIAAAVALVVGLNIDPRIAIAGVLVMLVLMVALVTFARVTQLKAKFLTAPAIFFLWAFVLLTVLWACLLTSSVFFNYPKHPKELFGPPAHEPKGTQA